LEKANPIISRIIQQGEKAKQDVSDNESKPEETRRLIATYSGQRKQTRLRPG